MYISGKIENCFQTHAECSRTGPGFLPARCLDLGGQPGETVRVITTSKIPGRYACLSHCWGVNTQTCTLTSANFEQFATGVLITTLPTTYGDAISLCRRLGIRFLWIDSLCIIQDSREDWQRECPKMTEYYGQCYVCIAATSSAEPNDGLKVDHRTSTVLNAEGSDIDGNLYKLLAFPTSELFKNIPHFSRTNSHDLGRHFPLMRRGWVFQERWLSPRIIHFGGKEFLFECSAGLVCECGHAKDFFSVDVGDGERELSTVNMYEGAVLKKAQLSKVSWTQLVVAYSSLNLTIAADRLPALSGLAREFADTRPEPPGEYLAGIWKKKLQHELVWFVGAPLLRYRGQRHHAFLWKSPKFWTAKNRRTKDYVAPTWSWASVFESVNYRSESSDQPLCELLDSHIELQRVDPFGSLSEGCFLKIKGPLIKTDWKPIIKVGIENVPVILTSIIGTQFLDRDDKAGIGFLPDYRLRKSDISVTEELFVLAVLSQGISIGRWRFSGEGESTPKSHLEHEKRLQQQAVESLRGITNTLCLVLRKRKVANVGDVEEYERVGFTEYANVLDRKGYKDPNVYEDTTFLLF